MKASLQRILPYLPSFIKKALATDHLRAAHIKMGIMNPYIEQNGELEVMKYISSYVNEPVLFDVGANKGEYAKHLSTQFRNAEIHCFEPNSAAFKELEKNDALISNNIALGHKNEIETLYVPTTDRSSTHSTLVRESLFRKKVINEEQIEIRTLSSYCEDNGVKRIDFLKIDTEGFELEVVKGAQSMLDSIHVIQFEMSYNLAFKRVFLRDFYDLLQDFVFYRVTKSGPKALGPYDPINEIFQMHNLLAINRKVSEHWNDKKSW